ncbi:hypothetical protein [Pseudoclavibacter helvolus]|uniref:hypothetical protein n=1 Tax=Pseudoclavibacter helvolus TaxID=255205 RepID=UPI003C70A34F
MQDATGPVLETDAVMREMVLEGQTAIQFIAALGWVIAPLNSRFHVVADLIKTDAFAIGRIWHTPAHLNFVRNDETSSNLFHFTYGIEGTQILTVEDGQLDLHPGQMHVQSLRAPLAITAREPVARLFYVSSREHLRGADGEIPSLRSGRLGASNAYREIFTSAAHAALNTVTSVGDAGFVRLRAALDNLFASVLSDDAHDGPNRSVELGAQFEDAEENARRPSLLRRASRHIEAHASEITFDAGRLARDLAVSSASLYRAYEGTDLTPATQLRRVRARRARRLLEAPGSQGRTDSRFLERVATDAGFGSVRAMRRALDIATDGPSVIDGGNLGESESHPGHAAHAGQAAL